jgi:hypothetical protein
MEGQPLATAVRAKRVTSNATVVNAAPARKVLVSGGRGRRVERVLLHARHNDLVVVGRAAKPNGLLPDSSSIRPWGVDARARSPARLRHRR